MHVALKIKFCLSLLQCSLRSEGKFEGVNYDLRNAIRNGNFCGGGAARRVGELFTRAGGGRGAGAGAGTSRNLPSCRVAGPRYKNKTFYLTKNSSLKKQLEYVNIETESRVTGNDSDVVRTLSSSRIISAISGRISMGSSWCGGGGRWCGGSAGASGGVMGPRLPVELRSSVNLRDLLGLSGSSLMARFGARGFGSSEFSPLMSVNPRTLSVSATLSSAVIWSCDTFTSPRYM